MISSEYFQRREETEGEREEEEEKKTGAQERGKKRDAKARKNKIFCLIG